VRADAVVIDIGISRANGKVIGDVDYENVSKKASWITPVPGGIGPMTIAMLLKNTVLAASRLMSR
jgi:methylenetetrahydrofolate dehydrogenase (NADP+)/methenyltetrahydrofolate cyclohydrolase